LKASSFVLPFGPFSLQDSYGQYTYLFLKYPQYIGLDLQAGQFCAFIIFLKFKIGAGSLAD